MKQIDKITKKLSEFRKKYHLNELIKGMLLLCLIASVYFILILLLEKSLWLSSGFRTFLFWCSIVLVSGVIIRFIIIPIIKMTSDRYKISTSNASKIIGDHFPEISDQLINLLQFETNNQSDLVLAAIDERAKNLSPFSFSSAIDFGKTLKFSKWLAIPVVLFILSVLIYGINWFQSPLERVVNYKTAYIPPAPFKFIVNQNTLKVLEGSNAVIQVNAVGHSLPDNAKIVIDEKEFFLNKLSTSKFSYTLRSLKESKQFYIKSGKVRSKSYDIEVLDAPTIDKFRVTIIPPKYTGIKSEVFKEQGNVEVPKGSMLSFTITSPKATNIEMIIDSSASKFNKIDSDFRLSKRFIVPVDYTILSSNLHAENFEKLKYQVDIIPDRSPIINVEQGKDSTNVKVNSFKVEVGDDYGFTRLEVVQTDQNGKEVNRILLKRPQKTLDIFNIDFDTNKVFNNSGSYSFYFEVYDNDEISGFKSAKSKVFNIKKNSALEELANNQNKDDSNIEEFSNSLEELDQTQKEFQEFNKLQKQKTNLDYKDKQKLEDLLDKQKRDQEDLKKLNNKLSNTLKKLEDKVDSKKSKEALERMKEQLEKNEKLLDEIKKAMKELKPNVAKEKMDELEKSNKSSKKTLKQILVRLKRQYIVNKHLAIVEMLELLANQHDTLALNGKLDFNKSEQKRLSDSWDTIQEELNELRRKNNELRRPMILDDDKNKERRIGKDINLINEAIKKKDIVAANTGQKVVAAMLRGLAKKMGETAGGGGGMSKDQLDEDKEMLRKVLDNLVVYSLDQESNMNLIKFSNSNDPSYSAYVRKQHGLKENFAHIDDSLFAIASRNEKVDLKINRLIEEVNYNIESSITKITDNQSRQGAVNMQYAISSSNELGLIIAETILELDTPSKPKSGEGKPKDDFQLPDIIKKQKSLQNALDQLLKSQQKKSGDSKSEGDSNKPKAGDKGSESDKGKEGNKGSEGKQSGQGKSGKGQSGDQGNSQSGESKESGNKRGNEDTKGNEKGDSKGKGKDSKEGSLDGHKSDKKGKGDKDGDGEGEGAKGNKGDKKGKKPGGNGEGDSTGDEENDLQEIFEIYKQQQDLRNQLEDAISKDGISPDERRVLNQMKAIENELIENGFNTETTKRMERLKHQLFKLKKAQFEQGKDDKRKSNVSKKDFESKFNSTNTRKVYYETKEILNRQALPLQSEYKQRVKTYFLK